MAWAGNFHAAPRNLINSVLGMPAMRSVRLTSRRGDDDNHAILMFDAESVAMWFINTWNDNPRIQYECCVASPLNG
jgi:hypothetical protein